MKNLLPLIMISLLALGCQEQEDKNRSMSYNMYQATSSPVRGEVIFTELADGKIQVEISLANTFKEVRHPAHLHFGSVKEIGELALALNPVDGNTGNSVTVLDQVPLSNGEVFSFDQLYEMNGSVKIHISETFFKDKVLSFGNIGKNENYDVGGVTVCTGH